MKKNNIQIKDMEIEINNYISNISIPRKAYIIAPDITRFHSHAGELTCILYNKIKDSCDCKIIIALGTHAPMTEEEIDTMYPGIPFEKFINHNFRKDVVKLGEVPSEFIKTISHGLCDFKIDVNINSLVMKKDVLLFSVGQVVPHEVVGMANGNKNLFVGIGGSSMINSSHYLGAVCDMEKIMGRDHSAVREVFDYAERNFLKDINLHYILTVVKDGLVEGLFLGKDRSAFENAVKLSQEENFVYVNPLKKVIVNLDEQEYKSTWLGNKSVYRTRLAIADDGELIVLGKGVERFGEDLAIDKLIRKYGYRGRDYILKCVKENDDLNENLSAAAHLIHGSSNGRFKITYCTKKVSKEEIEQVGFNYLPYDEAISKYSIDKLVPGNNVINDEEIYYIPNPAVGLWSAVSLD